VSAGAGAVRAAGAGAVPAAGGWIVYLLRCRDGSLYTGVTVDLERRIAEHNAGRGARYTRGRAPVDLIAASPPMDRSAAQRLEARVKRRPPERKAAMVAAG
jgi:putative endonuclease